MAMLRVATRALLRATKSFRSEISLLPVVGGLKLGFFRRIDFLELVVIAHIAGKLPVIHVVDQVDHAVQKGMS